VAGGCREREMRCLALEDEGFVKSRSIVAFSRSALAGRALRAPEEETLIMTARPLCFVRVDSWISIRTSSHRLIMFL
jgi:hypothetical protein